MKSAILFLKLTTWVVILVSIPAFFFHSFDPFYSLEGMILNDMYGTELPGEESLYLYRFSISLFALISIIYGVIQLYVIKNLIEKGDYKIVRILFFMMVIWVGGCTFLILKFNAWSYFYSAGGMALMWLPLLGYLTFIAPKKAG